MKTRRMITTIALAGGMAWSYGALAVSGVGGVSGSAAFNLSGSGPSANVDETSVAGSMGEDSAYSGANAVGGGAGLDAFALGLGGAITINNGTDDDVYVESTTANTAPGTAQSNVIDTGTAVIDFGTGGTVDVNNP